MLLCIDIGNTNSVVGLFHEGRLTAHWRLSTNSIRTIDEGWVSLSTLMASTDHRPGDLQGVVIGSVVPDCLFIWEKLAQRYLRLEPLVLEHDTPGMPRLCYEDPGTLGIDRVCNTTAAWALRGEASLVVDFGTATTIDIADDQGNFRGGVIYPGLGTAMRELHSRAATLPKVQLRFPERVIGCDTESALQSGILYGAVSCVEGLVERCRAELRAEGLSGGLPVLSTGGFGSLIQRHCACIDSHHPYLVLVGMALLYERARGIHVVDRDMLDADSDEDRP